MITNWLDQVSIIGVWERLGGGPVLNGRGMAFWCVDDSPNISLDSNLNVWFDHVNDSGGGVLSLVRTVLDCDRQTALRWLREEGFDGDLAQLETVDRQGAEKQADLRQRAEEICLWRPGYISRLEQWEEQVLIDLGKRLDPEESFAALEDVRRELSLMKTDPEAVIDAFRRCCAANPLMVEHLIELGREEEQQPKDYAAGILCLLSCDEAADAQLTNDPSAGRALVSPYLMVIPSLTRSPASELWNSRPKPKRLYRNEF